MYKDATHIETSIPWGLCIPMKTQWLRQIMSIFLRGCYYYDDDDDDYVNSEKIMSLLFIMWLLSMRITFWTLPVDIFLVSLL